MAASKKKKKKIEWKDTLTTLAKLNGGSLLPV